MVPLPVAGDAACAKHTRQRSRSTRMLGDRGRHGAAGIVRDTERERKRERERVCVCVQARERVVTGGRKEEREGGGRSESERGETGLRPT
eukprot:438095-Rhodomonas_salina.1